MADAYLAPAQETTQWYSALLQQGEAPPALEGTKVAVLRATMAPDLGFRVSKPSKALSRQPQAWKSAKADETGAERIVRCLPLRL